MILSSIFTDNMVFQANQPIRVFGKGKGKVSVEFNGECQSCISENDWIIEMQPHSYGGPYSMKIFLNDEKIVLNNIYIGEVWLCLGQSNMEMVLFRTEYGIQEAEHSYNDKIRLFTVPHRFKAEEKLHGWHFQKTNGEDTPWEICNKESSMHFSAIGYYVAKELQKKLSCAVGIINISWGGTQIETFIKRDFFYQSDILKESINKYNSMLECLDIEEYNEKYSAYLSDSERFYNELLYDESQQVAEMGVRATEGMPQISTAKAPSPGPYSVSQPGCLFDSMVSRIIPYLFRGVIWYQGESSPEQNYAQKYLVLMKCIRECFMNKELPFYAVELASFSNYWDAENCYKEGRFVEKNNWAFLREEQQKATEIGENNYLITSMGLGDLYDIHPIHKMELSRRITLKILRYTYCFDICADQPTFKSADFFDDKVILTFNNAESLYCRLPIESVKMYIADSSKELKEANIEIIGEKIILKSNEVSNPRYVRYGFDFAYVWGHIYNKAGLPLAPFRAEKEL